ncbi:DUF2931 family protein, partial [Erwinia amylovora]|uniref:DUF2931 family protein n=1 Tax=Erwinia amylovora TaxID=552 RepID=UPI003D6FAC28
MAAEQRGRGQCSAGTKENHHPVRRPAGRRQGNTAWYKTLLFGLAPEGKVRIWLQNSAAGDNVALEPKKITTLSGDQLD